MPTQLQGFLAFTPLPLTFFHFPFLVFNIKKLLNFFKNFLNALKTKPNMVDLDGGPGTISLHRDYTLRNNKPIKGHLV